MVDRMKKTYSAPRGFADTMLLALIAISILPLFAMIRKVSFESARWKDSAHSPFGQLTAGGDDDDEE